MVKRMSHSHRHLLARLTGLWIGLFFCIAPQALAQTTIEISTTPQDLEQINKAQAEAKAKAEALSRKTEKTKSEVARLKKNLQRSAAESASYEKASREIEKKLNALSRSEAQITGKLGHENAAQRELLAALQRLSETPPPALLLRAQSAAEAARAAVIMRDLNAQLGAQSAALSKELRALSKVRSEIHSEKSKLLETEKTLSQQRDDMRKLVKTKAALVNSLAADQQKAQKRAAALAVKANDLRELMSRIERSAKEVRPRIKPGPQRTGEDTGRAPSGRNSGPRLKPDANSPAPQPLSQPGATRFADARGALRAPAQGRVTSNYGGERKGVTLSTRPNTQVIAPFGGRIEFAGAFKNYDNVVILNVGQNYFMLLTGLGEIYVSSGEMVTSGEPLGLMPAGTQSAELYIELRKNGAPVNPKPWLGNALGASGG
jgi:septal ring factor EnvC (AmiA/AmiB activator)